MKTYGLYLQFDFITGVKLTEYEYQLINVISKSNKAFLDLLIYCILLQQFIYNN